MFHGKKLQNLRKCATSYLSFRSA